MSQGQLLHHDEASVWMEQLMTPETPHSTASERKRSKIACEPCRQRKRKCNGAVPCFTCKKLDYECYYGTIKRKRRKSVGQSTAKLSNSPTHLWRDEAGQSSDAQDQLRSVEANSGAAFVRRLALKLDPANAPRLNLFAWNVFLGSRQTGSVEVTRTAVVEILSQSHMETLARIYFEKVDPCYGFLDRKEVEDQIQQRWSFASSHHHYDAVLCGVAALGCLFSQLQMTELEGSLLRAARVGLDEASSEAPNNHAVAAWILHVAYLRIVGAPHAAWMASCTLMHIVEATGLHAEPTTGSVLQDMANEIDDELRRRLFGVAQHLNVWMSYDLGRSRVTLQNVTMSAPAPRPGNFTTELLALLPYTDLLDPSTPASSDELASALSEVLKGTHVQPPSVLAQCNLVLCLYRRLRSSNTSLPSKLIDQILILTDRGLRSAQTLLDEHSPWHQIANVPFQVICILLAMDTPASLAQLEFAVQTLENVIKVYNTEPLLEAARAASLVILLHQRRKEADVLKLGNVLRRHPAPTVTLTNNRDVTLNDPQPQSEDGTAAGLWFDNPFANIEDLQDFNIDQFFYEGYY